MGTLLVIGASGLDGRVALCCDTSLIHIVAVAVNLEAHRLVRVLKFLISSDAEAVIFFDFIIPGLSLVRSQNNSNDDDDSMGTGDNLNHVGHASHDLFVEYNVAFGVCCLVHIFRVYELCGEVGENKATKAEATNNNARCEA